MQENTRRLNDRHAREIIEKYPPPGRQSRETMKRDYANFIGTMARSNTTLRQTDPTIKLATIDDPDHPRHLHYGNLDEYPMMSRNEIVALIMTMSEKTDAIQRIELDQRTGKPLRLVDKLHKFYDDIRGGQIMTNFQLVRVANQNLDLYHVDGMHYLQL